ncbi:MAG: hypothetical protein IK115_02140 [Lachnospiraceae bacterium]|nr:hypothetical protein [Lachnospiraceae bacterium]
MDIIERISQKKSWEEFLEYKKSLGHLDRREEKEWRFFIDEGGYRDFSLTDPLPLPVRGEINKSGSSKKRVIYSFPEPFNRILKGISFFLYRYDGIFCESCYAFRRNKGVGDAISRYRKLNGASSLWCLKADISNYFNSLDVSLLIEKLSFLRREDERLFLLFRKLLENEYVNTPDGSTLREEHGAMAGIPVAPFFANVYLSDVDEMFGTERYFRYSDDILLLAEDEEELIRLRDKLFSALDAHGLKINEEKLHIYRPGEAVDFLGFSLYKQEVDLSGITKEKLKGKIRRRARALRRWSTKKKLPGDRPAKGFIRAMNRKLYSSEGKDFSWARWFFPYLTTDKSLHELDAYMEQYMRYCVTGRHYKGNYRISYEELKDWGFRSLVHEWWEGKENRKE